MEAVKAGVNGLHLTVNGMGERAGNAPLASVVAVINDFMPEINISINEDSLFKVSQLVATLTGFRIPANKPIVGENVFTQTAGIHAYRIWNEVPTVLMIIIVVMAVAKPI